MSKEIGDKRLQGWKAEPFSERVYKCLMMLYAHGFVSLTERDKIRERIEQRVGARKAQQPEEGDK